jgi:hypothetical protein
MLTRHVLSAMSASLLKLASPEEAPYVDEESAQQEQPEPQKMPELPAITAAKTLGSFGLGTMAGYGGLLGANELSKAMRGNKPLFDKLHPAMHALPAISGIGTVAFNHAQRALFDRMQENAEKRRAMRGQ